MLEAEATEARFRPCFSVRDWYFSNQNNILFYKHLLKKDHVSVEVCIKVETHYIRAVRFCPHKNVRTDDYVIECMLSSLFYKR